MSKIDIPYFDPFTQYQIINLSLLWYKKKKISFLHCSVRKKNAVLYSKMSNTDFISKKWYLFIVMLQSHTHVSM